MPLPPNISKIEELVLGELAGHQELERIDRGFRWLREAGETRLWFQPTTMEPDDFSLCATAFIETIFAERIPAPDDSGLARLNRRASFGSFFVRDGRLGLRASYCIYEKETATNWVAIILLRAMGEQLALGVGIAHSEFVPDKLAYNRANLEYPRRWTAPPEPSAIEANAKRFIDAGLVATRGSHGLVLEVPLAEGPASRMIDPTAETALLQVSVDTPHPLAGVGYLGTIALPYDPAKAAIPEWCRLLNEEEHTMQDFVPRLGAWGVRGTGNELVYSMFWPTDRADRTLDGTIMNWLVQRTFWLRSRHWKAGVGLTGVPTND